ncbi:hypothetical protein [Lewinella sp. 4G2]|uniref:hypothetical protein n=1 Tax=Lewinella sp. 4G2 TaxID=1803372 RepID=UPI0007B48417|nr:hypothetical protein [Lewinella sp. 4G2]OAV45395.1 hypothetical protein A3850_013230 [Lewinella sp. 4G2]
MAHLQTKLIRRGKLDDGRWNAAIENDVSRLPYGYTWWLDAVMGENWEALVYGDYRAVLPLPYSRSLLGLKQISRPAFTQQIGPWGELTEASVGSLLNAIPKKVLKLDVGLSEAVKAAHVPSHFAVKERTNQIVDMDKDYTDIHAHYGRTLRKILRRYEGSTIQRIGKEKIIDVYQKHLAEKAGLNDQHFVIMHRLMTAYEREAGPRFFGLHAPDDGLQALGFFPDHRGRVINLFAASTEAGYDHDGMARLLDGIIRREVGPDKLLDFEGSDIEGIAKFFNRFRPHRSPYLQVSRQLLP